jgi:hypothetical protein
VPAAGWRWCSHTNAAATRTVSVDEKRKRAGAVREIDTATVTLHDWRRSRLRLTLAPVVTSLSARVDRRVADLMLARARRRWPLLRLLPRTCARRLILPAATLARQDVVRVVGLAALFAGSLLLLILGF